MSFEFLADTAIKTPAEGVIDDIVEGRNVYVGLSDATWIAKAQVLSTGLAYDDRFENLLKNGREKNEKKGITAIGAYPGLLQKQGRSFLPGEWTPLFEPQEAMIRRLPLWSALVSIELKLKRPFFSRDDLSFYPCENPVKREWIFGVPYLSAAAVKGLLRWAWRMQWGDAKKTLEEQIFGPRSEEMTDENAQQGCLWTYPLFWNGKVGLDIINPHDRETGVGKRPIKYEVVRAGALGNMHLLILNRTGEKAVICEILDALRPAVRLLLEQGGVSSKRSADWGTVHVMTAKTFLKAVPGEIKAGSNNEKGKWDAFTDEEGKLKSLEDESVFTTAVLAELTGNSKSWVKKHKAEARARVKEIWEEAQKKSKMGEGEKYPIVRFEDLKIDSLFENIGSALKSNPM